LDAGGFRADTAVGDPMRNWMYPSSVARGAFMPAKLRHPYY